VRHPLRSLRSIPPLAVPLLLWRTQRAHRSRSHPDHRHGLPDFRRDATGRTRAGQVPPAHGAGLHLPVRLAWSFRLATRRTPWGR